MINHYQSMRIFACRVWQQVQGLIAKGLLYRPIGCIIMGEANLKTWS
ncbi:hypothetical protein PALA111701_00205 [Paenibacillus lactis]